MTQWQFGGQNINDGILALSFGMNRSDSMFEIVTAQDALVVVVRHCGIKRSEMKKFGLRCEFSQIVSFGAFQC